MKQTILTAIGVIGGLITSLFGGWDAALVTLIIFMGIDTASYNFRLALTLSELQAFPNSTERSLLEHRPTISLPVLIRQTADLDKLVTKFKAVDGFAPAKATFITENEIDQFLMATFSFKRGRIRVYSYFMQGHDAKECAAFLWHECGDMAAPLRN